MRDPANLMDWSDLLARPTQRVMKYQLFFEELSKDASVAGLHADAEALKDLIGEGVCDVRACGQKECTCMIIVQLNTACVWQKRLFVIILLITYADASFKCDLVHWCKLDDRCLKSAQNLQLNRSVGTGDRSR